eukprot:694663-Rhodomonas_salina.1
MTWYYQNGGLYDQAHALAPPALAQTGEISEEVKAPAKPVSASPGHYVLCGQGSRLSRANHVCCARALFFCAVRGALLSLAAGSCPRLASTRVHSHPTLTMESRGSCLPLPLSLPACLCLCLCLCALCSLSLCVCLCLCLFPCRGVTRSGLAGGDPRSADGDRKAVGAVPGGRAQRLGEELQEGHPGPSPPHALLAALLFCSFRSSDADAFENAFESGIAPAPAPAPAPARGPAAG